MEKKQTTILKKAEIKRLSQIAGNIRISNNVYDLISEMGTERLTEILRVINLLVNNRSSAKNRAIVTDNDVREAIHIVTGKTLSYSKSQDFRKGNGRFDSSKEDNRKVKVQSIRKCHTMTQKKKPEE